MRVLSLKNAIQLHIMVHIHTHTLVYMHALKVNCLRLCAHTFLYLSLYLSLPFTLLHSFGFGSLQKRATATIARAWPGENSSKDAKPPPPGTNYLLSFGCLAGKYIACGWCASRIYVAPAPFVQHMGAYCFKYNCFKFFISYKNLRPTGPRGVKCLGFQHSIKREFI